MDAVSQGDENVLDALLDEDLVDHNPMPDQQSGCAGFKQWMRSARAAFPDLSVRVEDVLVEGDRVAGRVRYLGTHGGRLVGVPATGKAVDFEAFHIVRFHAGRIVEWWGAADLLGALNQIGAVVALKNE